MNLSTWLIDHGKRFAKSATVWVGAFITALPEIVMYLQTNAAEVAKYIPASWGSKWTSLLGIAVLVARARSLVKLPPAAGPVLLVCLLVPLLHGCGSAEAQQQTDTVSWTLPTARENGAALPASEIAKTTVKVRASATSSTNLSTVDVAAPGTSVVIPRSGSGFGTVCYVATVTDTGGRESAETAAACKTLVARPGAPTGLAVQ
jgi:hypothetical protein